MSDADDDGRAASPPLEETEAERVLPWKRTTQVPPVRSSMSLSMPDDDHPLMSQAPSWADNLAYNHLTESGSPYVSPENTIGARAPASSHRPIFDIFPPTTPALGTGNSSPDKAGPEPDPIPPPWSYQGSLPAPWASESSEEPPLTSPEAHDVGVGGGGEKASSYLQSSSHNYYPPSHHNCIQGVAGDERDAEVSPSGGSVRLRPSRSPKHFQPFQPLEMCSRHGIQEEIIADEADYQERLTTRVQSWLDTSSPTECEEAQDSEELDADCDGVPPHNDTDDDTDVDGMHFDTYL